MDHTHPTRDLVRLRDFLRHHLLEEVMPFWLKHAVDPAGGLNTCIADDGTIINREKWLWSQWRAVWVFSALHTMIEPRTQWLEQAWQIFHFVTAHGWDETVGGWKLLVDHDGNTLRGCESIYTDGFAVYGALALARASGDQKPLDWALRTADHLLERLAAPHDQIPHFPYPVPAGARVHGIPMMMSLTFWELAEHTGNPHYRQAAQNWHEEIFRDFYRRDRDLMVERIASDGGELPGPQGTAVVPGHVIEDMWFQMHIARDRDDQARIHQCIALTQRHLQLGWDTTYGGILLAVDADGNEPVGWNFADSKLWWPHTETLYTLLLAYEHTRAPWCLDWYDKVHAYAFAHYPVAEHGEWRQKLDRQGQPLTGTVALPVKDPFHLPRALIYCVDVLDRLVDA